MGGCSFRFAFKSGFNLPAKVLAYTNDLEKEGGMTPVTTMTTYTRIPSYTTALPPVRLAG